MTDRRQGPMPTHGTDIDSVLGRTFAAAAAEIIPACPRCEGAGVVWLMPNGPDIECPECQGTGSEFPDDAV